MEIKISNKETIVTIPVNILESVKVVFFSPKNTDEKENPKIIIKNI
ncbi:hypothetical protein QOZ91_002083 [Clostridium sardiniense]|nr:hypothetical protein [Clostridium sardiniense]